MTYFYLFDKIGREKHQNIHQFARNLFEAYEIDADDILGIFEDLGGGYIIATRGKIDESLSRDALVVVAAPKELEDNFYGILRELLIPYFKGPFSCLHTHEFEEKIKSNGGKILKL